jgi:hypothetical protein
MQMRPVDEADKGKHREYHEAVRVKRLTGGQIQITEQDGDQFTVSTAGVSRSVQKGPKVAYTDHWGKARIEGTGKMGTQDGGAAHATYAQDNGVEFAYFGRGYVQLTWWENYISAGIRLGRGFDFLFDPEIVKQPEIAYRLMSDGMRLGVGFANGRRFSMYFSGMTRDYVGARAMVNGTNEAHAIATIAELFEAILLASKKQ